MTDPASYTQPCCWVLSDGKAGTEVQSLGLAEALELEPEIKRFEIRAPWRWLPPSLWVQPFRALASGGARLAPPWPEVLIASGRLTAAPALAVRRASRGATFAIQIQNAKVAPRRFDLVVAPRHDRLSGANVLSMLGALHRVTPRRLADAAARLAPRLAHLPRPRIAVLIGGTSKAYRMTPRGARRLATQLASLARDQGVGLMITVSRRTGAENEALLRAELKGVQAAFWDGQGDNPYLGYLGLADALIVTSDSVTMISEAAATGKPVHVVEMAGGSAKFRRFHAAMREAGITRPFAGRIEDWSYAPLDETARIAAEVKRRLEGRLRRP
ncbi:MAG: mitochondrial fission ELM1 family protein [Rhodospirillales bacterium]|nr:mitochondrial fission ELM1 family protein [Rhodospirillales bacterium]MDH3967617.1 mitochondrial fission ELM1 family protein [Rhodospirillales bacterium]